MSTQENKNTLTNLRDKYEYKVRHAIGMLILSTGTLVACILVAEKYASQLERFAPVMGAMFVLFLLFFTNKK